MATVADSNVEHLEWVDVLKGLGILTVVWGHSGSQNAVYMFWFHMPLFFFVSGYLYRYKPQQTGLAYVQRKAKRLLVPYVFYLLLITLMMFSVNIWKGQPAGRFFRDNWAALLLGGSLLEGAYATFWFISCLFIVQILYDYFCRKVPSPFYKGLFLVGCYLIAYWESRYLSGIFVPWNGDVALFALVFYALGHMVKQSKLLERPNIKAMVFGLSLVIALGFIFLYSQRILDYGLDMKHRQYYYFGTNLIIPLIFTFLLIQLSMIFSKCLFINNALIGLGRAAMVIMYLHLSAVYLVRQIFSITPIRFLVIGILVPLLFYRIIKVFSYGKLLGLGESKGEVNNRLVSRVHLEG
ncbi:MAG: acyltransferase family protein [Desulfosporosinus sp.]